MDDRRYPPTSMAAEPAERVEVEVAQGVVIVADVSGPVGGPPALLLHGGGQTRHAWHGTAAALARAGWRTASMDMRGHGESSWAPDGDYRPDAFAADALAMAEVVGERPVFIGASLGGISSLVAVGEATAPVARGLVLVDVAPRISRDGVERIISFMQARPEGFASLDEVADAVAAYNPHRPRPTDLEGLKRNVRQREDGRWIWHWDPRFLGQGEAPPDETRVIGYEERLRDAARAVTVPTLLVRGARSDLLEEDGAADLLELIPHARYARVDGAGHMVAGDKNEVFNGEIVRFVSGLT